MDIEKETVTVLQRVKGCLKELAADSSNAEDKELLNRIVQVWTCGYLLVI